MDGEAGVFALPHVAGVLKNVYVAKRLRPAKEPILVGLLRKRLPVMNNAVQVKNGFSSHQNCKKEGQTCCRNSIPSFFLLCCTLDHLIF